MHGATAHSIDRVVVVALPVGALDPMSLHYATFQRIFGNSAADGMPLWIAALACLTTILLAHRLRTPRSAIIERLSPVQLERPRAFERVKGDWRDFCALLRRRL
jgi:hypothetical protein